MPSSKKEILLIGGGGHCKAVIDVIEQENKFTIAGIIDKQELVGEKIFGYDIIGTDDELEQLSKHYKYACITVGQIRSNDIRVNLFHLLKKLNYELPTIISPLAYVSKYSVIGESTIIMHHVLVNANAKIGYNCIINTKSLLEHDTEIGSHCHISTGTIINGGTIVVENSFVGSNSTSKEYSKLNGFIKAGEVVK